MKTKLLFPLLLSTLVLSAQTPDPSFGVDGTTNYEFGPFDAQFEAACLQSDNKILSVGYNGLSYNEVLVTRHLANGTLDDTFNGTGIRQFSYGSSNEFAHTILQLQSGKIAIGGSSFGKAAIAVLNDDGSLDNSFNGDGTLAIDFGPGNGSKIEQLIQQPDGKIIGVGNAYNGSNFDFMICRLTEDGSLDPDFGSDGTVVFDIDGWNDFAYDVDFQTSGDIVVGGFAFNNTGVSQFAAIRILSDGTLDIAFGDDGYFLLKELSIFNEIEGLQVDSENRIVMAGRMNNDMAVIRLTENGIADNTFSDDGIININFNGNADRAYDVTIQSDGKIIAAGWITTDFGTNDFAVARLLSNGTLDDSFDGDGKFTYEMGEGGSWTKQVLLTAENKILLGGQASLSFGSYANFVLLQLTNEITIDVNQSTPETVIVYPNPVATICYINYTLPGEWINIYNQLGQWCFGTRVINNTIDLSPLPNGLYYIKLPNTVVSIVKSEY